MAPSTGSQPASSLLPLLNCSSVVALAQGTPSVSFASVSLADLAGATVAQALGKGVTRLPKIEAKVNLCRQGTTRGDSSLVIKDDSLSVLVWGLPLAN